MVAPTKEYAQKVLSLLEDHYPHAKMVLQWGNNFELLVAVILSAQCTDKKVNEVTAKLFPKYRLEKSTFVLHYQKYMRIALPSEQKVELANFAFVPLAQLEQDIKSTGFYHNKAKNVQAAAQVTLDIFKGILPKTIHELTTIPGVGRKTANVFLTNAYHLDEGIAVDTHVIKQSNALGLTTNTDPKKIEQDLMALFPHNQWNKLTYLLIEHGRTMRKRKTERVTCGNPTCILCYK